MHSPRDKTRSRPFSEILRVEKPFNYKGIIGRSAGLLSVFSTWLAEGVGFEPTVRFPVHTLSKRAP